MGAGLLYHPYVVRSRRGDARPHKDEDARKPQQVVVFFIVVATHRRVIQHELVYLRPIVIIITNAIESREL
jgi:hypothetical protein